MKRAVIFGLGKLYQMFLRVYDSAKVDIIAVSDNNISLMEKYKNFVVPEKISELHFDYIIITSSFYTEVKSQLVGYGILENCILNFDVIYKKMLYQNDYELIDLLKDNIPLKTGYEQDFEHLKILGEKNLFLSARNFINSICNKPIASLEEVEFQVFSQFGEDGIIQWLIHNVDLKERTFVEFGVEDYTEANTRFLLMNNNWTGLVIDGSEENINHLKNWESLWKYDLNVVSGFITKDNINQMILDAGFEGDIGLLSVDVDGNDYWVLNAITCIKPRILICEYNNLFGPDKKVSVPYDEKFYRTDKHYSNLYWGASLGAFCDWAERNGFCYMGSNSAGNNAFFVRKDCISEDKIPAHSQIFINSKYRESRDKNGCLTYLRGRERLEEIKEMELVDIVHNRAASIQEIYQL